VRLDDSATTLPIGAESARQPGGRLRIRQGNRVGERGAQVVVFKVERLEPPFLPRRPQLWLGLLGQGQEICRMPSGDSFGLPAGPKPLGRELTEGLQ
jgi:hypothetical protein